MKRVLYIKRKGFNYYTDYTELYLHNALQNYGYNLIRECDKSTFSVTLYISENEKYMALLSPFFDSINENDLLTLCENFSKAFKSEVIVSACPDDSTFPGDKEIFLFSENFNAFDEPVYLTEETPELKRKMADCFFKTNTPYLIRFANTGGKLTGIRIVLDFNEDISSLTIVEAEITYYENKKEISRPLTFTYDGTSLCTKADFICIEKGINTASAFLRGKKLYNEEIKYGFSLKITPVSSDNTTLTPTLRIYTEDREIYKERLFFPPNNI